MKSVVQICNCVIIPSVRLLKSGKEWTFMTGYCTHAQQEKSQTEMGKIKV